MNLTNVFEPSVLASVQSVAGNALAISGLVILVGLGAVGIVKSKWFDKNQGR